MTLRDRLQVAFVALLHQSFFSTYFITVKGYEHLQTAPPPLLYALWHGHQFPLLPLLCDQGIGVIVSQSRDGERVAWIMAKWGYIPIRGSSSRGGVPGLLGLVHHLKKGLPGAVTVDGPKGPIYQPKPGVVRAARIAHASLIPMAVKAPKSWRLKSWDRYLIPKPFSRWTACFGPPVKLSNSDDKDVETLKKALFALAKEETS